MKRSKYLVLEFTEFNIQRMNPDSVQPASQVDDPQLSINAFDKHEDLVRQSISRLGQLHGALSNTTAYRSLKSKLSLEDQDVKHLTIIRIVKNQNLNYDAYIKFQIGEEIYWGVVKDLLGNTEFKSEVFKEHDLVQTKEWIIKLNGFIIKNIKNWLKPQFGKFKLVKDEVICYSLIDGKMLKMTQNSEIEVLKSYDNKIIFKFENEKYALTGDNFMFFNWWFSPIEKED